MLPMEKLKTGKIYDIPGSQNQVRLTGKFDLDSLCFMRVRDSALHYGHEFVEIHRGFIFLNLEEAEK